MTDDYFKKRLVFDGQRHFISMRIISIRWTQLHKELSEDENRLLAEEEEKLIDEYCRVTDEIIALEFERLQQQHSRA